MKYALHFYKKSNKMDKADEIIIEYTHRTSELIKFAGAHLSQRVVVDITKYNDADNPLESSLEIFEAAAALKNIVIKLSNEEQSSLVPDLYDLNIPYFFSEKVNTWDRLAGFIKMGVTDVYITDEFAFEMKDISDYCKKNNVSIRVYPNVAQSSCSKENFGLNTFTFFFIRPEDVKVYENYIDVLEFYGNIAKQDVLYTIYNEDKVWKGDLRYLILGLREKVTGSTMYKEFGEKRLNCKKRCTLNKCGLCDRILNLSSAMLTLGYGFKEEEENNTLNLTQNLDEE